MPSFLDSCKMYIRNTIVSVLLLTASSSCVLATESGRMIAWRELEEYVHLGQLPLRCSRHSGGHSHMEHS